MKSKSHFDVFVIWFIDKTDANFGKHKIKENLLAIFGFKKKNECDTNKDRAGSSKVQFTLQNADQLEEKPAWVCNHLWNKEQIYTTIKSQSFRDNTLKIWKRVCLHLARVQDERDNDAAGIRVNDEAHSNPNIKLLVVLKII